MARRDRMPAALRLKGFSFWQKVAGPNGPAGIFCFVARSCAAPMRLKLSALSPPRSRCFADAFPASGTG